MPLYFEVQKITKSNLSSLNKQFYFLSRQVSLWRCRITYNICIYWRHCSTGSHQSDHASVCASEQYLHIQCHETDISHCGTVIVIDISHKECEQRKKMCMTQLCDIRSSFTSAVLHFTKWFPLSRRYGMAWYRDFVIVNVTGYYKCRRR